MLVGIAGGDGGTVVGSLVGSLANSVLCWDGVIFEGECSVWSAVEFDRKIAVGG